MFLWWCTGATFLVAISDWFLEAYNAPGTLRVGVDGITAIFWVGGVGSAGWLYTTAKSDESCADDPSYFPENGALITFALFEFLLFASGAVYAFRIRSWPREEGEQSATENASQAASTVARPPRSPVAMPTRQTSHLKTGDFGEYITVHVGSGEHRKDFPVPKGPICRRSNFVKSAVSDHWTTRLGRASKPQEVDLSDGDPESFEAYLQCVLSNTVSVKDLDDKYPTRMQSDGVFERLIRAYILADKLGDPDSANCIVDCLSRYSLGVRRLPHGEAVAMAYAGSTNSSPLRLLLVDLYEMGYDQEATAEDRLESMPQEFLVHYMTARSRGAQTVVPGSQRYHQSSTTEPTLILGRGLYRSVLRED